MTAAPSSTATAPVSPSITLGQSDSAGAIVTGNAAAGSPTGTVTFYECGPTPVATPCTSTANPVGADVTVTPGAHNKSSAASVSFTPTSTGFWCFANSYSGDSNYSASADVTADGCFDVTAAKTTTVATLTNTTISLGQTDADSVTVTGNSAGGSPTGTVTFYRCGPASVPAKCTSKSHKVGGPIDLTAVPSDASIATSAAFKPTAVGYWCFAAYYSGDTNYRASSTTASTQCVNVTGPPSIITTSLPKGTKGVAYSYTLAARGGVKPYAWGKTGSLPFGVRLDSSTGVISGTPTTSGSYTVTFKVTDSSTPRETATKVLTLVIAS